MTGRQWVTDVLQDIGKFGVGDVLSDEDAQFVLRRANQWISSLALEKLLVFYLARSLKTLTSGRSSYTIGVGGDINIVRPTEIERAGLMLTVGTQLQPPATLTSVQIGVAGVTHYDYRVTAIDAGGETTPRVATVLLTGNATLSAANYNLITWAAVTGAIGYRLYRANTTLIEEFDAETLTYNDVGAVGTAVVPPTTNTTAGSDTVGAPGTEIPVHVLTVQEWRGITIKKLSSPLCRAVYYDKNWVAGLGTIFPFPVPSVGTTQLVLYTRSALAAFADLDTDYTFPDGYELFLRTNLAAEVASGFGKVLTPDQQRSAIRARALVKRGNIRNNQSRIDPATPGAMAGGVWDYRTGDFKDGP